LITADEYLPELELGPLKILSRRMRKLADGADTNHTSPWTDTETAHTGKFVYSTHMRGFTLLKSKLQVLDNEEATSSKLRHWVEVPGLLHRTAFSPRLI